MGKLFKSSQYVEDMVGAKFTETGLDPVLSLKIMSTTKASEVIKVSKASQETEFLTNDSNVVSIIVYEAAFERLDEEGQSKLIEGAISKISYDNDKDKIEIDKSDLNMINRMRHKYSNDVLDYFEQGIMAIEQIEEEEKEAKEAKKAEKYAKKVQQSA
jgi:hypothetical protein